MMFDDYIEETVDPGWSLVLGTSVRVAFLFCDDSRLRHLQPPHISFSLRCCEYRLHAYCCLPVCRVWSLSEVGTNVEDTTRTSSDPNPQTRTVVWRRRRKPYVIARNPIARNPPFENLDPPSINFARNGQRLRPADKERKPHLTKRVTEK
jgi:hypothetical protein